MTRRPDPSPPHPRLVIEADGSFSPKALQLQRGDTLSVLSREADAVLCVQHAEVFGEKRYEIPAQVHVQLVVRAGAPTSFDFVIAVGDLSRPCGGTRSAAASEGTGRVEGGPD